MMAWPISLRTWRIGLTTRRYQRVLIASLVTLLTSAVLLGLIGFMRWRSRQALRSDTSAILTQAGQELVRALQSRRGTLTFIRDTLNRRTDLTLPQLQAMGKSAVEHTRHLLGTGLIRASQSPVWWEGPQGLTSAEREQLNRAIVQRTQLRGVWRVPSTFITSSSTTKTLLVMLEPLRATAYAQSAIIGVFDFTPLLGDFFASNLSQPHPVQLLDGQTRLYRSSGWENQTPDRTPIVTEQSVTLDSARWTLQMQPGVTRVVQTLSWLTVLLIALSIITGIGVTIIVWTLAARTWILQRAVARRTAALRRTTERLRQMASTDELTGLYNRRFFLDRWEWECERAKRYQRPLACLMIDVNGFKQVNDQLGHPAGDVLLKQVAHELQMLLRQSDILARFGGDEFIIALPETSEAQASLVAEKLRQVRIPVPQISGRLPPVSLSVGMSRIEEENETPQEILQAADQSLYAFKRNLKRPVPRTHARIHPS